MICVLATLLSFGFLAAAQSNSVLYGMSASIQLETINTTTAQPIFTWPALPYEAQAQGVSSIDSTNGIFYIVGTNLTNDVIALVGVSAINGSVVVEIPLPFLLEAFIGVGQYVDVDETTGNVYVTGRDPQSLSHFIYRVNPFTKELHLIAKVGDGQEVLEVLGGISVFDSLNRVLWIQLARNDSGNILIRFYGYDADTGFLLNVIDDEFGLDTMDFYPSTGLIYGIGYKPESSNYQRTLVSLNSATTVFTQIGIIPGFSDLLGAVSAIDDANGILWVYMTAKKTNEPLSHPSNLRINKSINVPIPSMNLVGIDIATAKVAHSALACAQFPDCPWNIQSLS